MSIVRDHLAPGTEGLLQNQPTLRSDRLILRPFEPEDAWDVERLAGRREIADTTLNIPHPYPVGTANAWIAKHTVAWERQTDATFAIIETTSTQLAGAISLMSISREHRRAELGYWIAVNHWNKGYATESGRLMLQLGFETLGLHRIEARHFQRNPASGRVLAKLGMQREGVERDWAVKWGKFETAVVYSILETEWKSSQNT
jgi:ribosomal-protein-alanine N-acetyltransferase